MTPETLFTICNTAVLPAWLLLALAPGWKWTHHLVHSAWIPMLLGIVYVGVFATNAESPEGGGFGSLEGVMLLFTSPHAVLAGWIHYLAFDLAIGAMIARRADASGLTRLVQIPILFFTFMFGPLGFLLFILTDGGWRAIARLGGAAEKGATA